MSAKKTEWNYLGNFTDNHGVLFGLWYKENGGRELEFFVLGDSESGELAEPLNLGKIRLDQSKHLLRATERGDGEQIIEVGNDNVIESYSLKIDGNPHLKKVKSVRYFNDQRDELGGFQEWTGHLPGVISLERIESD